MHACQLTQSLALSLAPFGSMRLQRRSLGMVVKALEATRWGRPRHMGGIETALPGSASLMWLLQVPPPSLKCLMHHKTQHLHMPQRECTVLCIHPSSKPQVLQCAVRACRNTQSSAVVNAAPVLGTSPGASFPAGTSPGGGRSRRSHANSPGSQQPSKWFVQVS